MILYMYTAQDYRENNINSIKKYSVGLISIGLQMIDKIGLSQRQLRIDIN